MKRALQKLVFVSVGAALNLGSRLPLIGGVFARYESAWQGWGERSWLQQSLQDARFDIDAATRQELQRRHRYWVSNSQLVQKIRSLFIQFSVGPSGLQCVPNSSDEEWNECRANSFEVWSRCPDVSSLSSLRQLTITWAGQLFDDGEFFILKTKDKKGRPAIQTIEAHRVATPSGTKEFRGRPIVDGVVTDANGRPTHYAVRVGEIEKNNQPPASDDFVFVEASHIIHKFKVQRPGQLRGLPEGFSCMNILHDFDDLQKLEMQCAKLAAEIATVETNPSGELDTYANRKARMRIMTQDGGGNAATKTVYSDYNVSFAGKRYALRTGDKLENFMVNRPTVVQQQYWDLLITQICCGYKTPKLLAMPYSLQGTVTRADLDVCANQYRFNFEIIADALREIYEWQGVWANDFDMTQDGVAPDDHHRVVIRAPRAPNVDIGYTAKNLETELGLGVKTMQDVYAERQQDWREQTVQIAEYLAFVKKTAAKFGVEAGQITKLAIENESPAEEATETEGEPTETTETQVEA
jgi:hypothetical protein